MSHPLLNKLKKFIKRLTDGLKKVDEALKLAEELQERKEVNRIDHYEPYPYQTEFHKAQDLFGTRAKQRLLMAANKVGKTFSEPQNSQYILQENIQIGGQDISSTNQYVHGPQATRQETQEILSRQSCWVSQEIRRLRQGCIA